MGCDNANTNCPVIRVGTEKFRLAFGAASHFGIALVCEAAKETRMTLSKGSTVGGPGTGGGGGWLGPDSTRRAPGPISSPIPTAPAPTPRHRPEAALAEAGTGAGLGDLVAVLGLAGANVRATVARLVAGLPFARVVVESETGDRAERRDRRCRQDVGDARHRLDLRPAARRDHHHHRRGGGSRRRRCGARLGRAFLEAALLAHDGLAAPSPLLAAVVEEAVGGGLVAFASDARPAAFAAYVLGRCGRGGRRRGGADPPRGSRRGGGGDRPADRPRRCRVLLGGLGAGGAAGWPPAGEG